MSRISELLERCSGRIILTAIFVTFLLAIPLIATAPDEDASFEPRGEVFDLREEIEDRFSSSVFAEAYVVESRSGDVLSQATLSELYENERRLREADRMGELHPEGLPAQPYLFAAFDTDTNRPFLGVYTIADAVQELLQSDERFGVSLAAATDEQVKLALHELMRNPETAEISETLSSRAERERRVVAGNAIDYWTSPALVFRVLADNEKLGGNVRGGVLSASDEDLDKEEFSRNVQTVLRGDEQSYRAWGIAIDASLEAEDEGKVAGMFIMLTVVAAVGIVGLSLRSYWVTALTGAGLGILMIWLKGISNLVGIEGGLVIELIVPIAMISLGVDFVVHALRRYREEMLAGNSARRALRTGFAGVLGALVLAMLSDSIAFLANASSGVEAVVHFGVAAAIAVSASFLVLGVLVPLVMMRIDELRGSVGRPSSLLGRVLPAVGAANVAMLSGTAVIFLVTVSPVAGLVLIVASIVIHVLLPLILLKRMSARGSESDQRPLSVPAVAEEGGFLTGVLTTLAGPQGVRPPGRRSHHVWLDSSCHPPRGNVRGQGVFR